MVKYAFSDRIQTIRTYLIRKLTGRPPRVTRLFSTWAMEVIFLNEEKLRLKYLIMMAVSMNRSLLGRCTKNDFQIIIEHYKLRLTSEYGIIEVDWDYLISGITLESN